MSWDTSISKPTNRFRRVLQHLPPNSELLLDREFDVNDNYIAGFDNRINLQIRQKSPDKIHSSHRKKGKRLFDQNKYRRRKLGERVFGNIKKRRVKCYYRSKRAD